VIAIARLTLATIAADSGVLRGMILVPSPFDIAFLSHQNQVAPHVGAIAHRNNIAAASAAICQRRPAWMRSLLVPLAGDAPASIQVRLHPTNIVQPRGSAADNGVNRPPIASAAIATRAAAIAGNHARRRSNARSSLAGPAMRA
jgi:hypothetical protein